MKRRWLMLAVLFVMACASANVGPVLQEKEVGLAALTADNAPLDVEVFRTALRVHRRERLVDVALARDRQNGLTFWTIVSIGDRPFGGIEPVLKARNDVRFVENDGRLFAFDVFVNSIHIREFSDRYASLDEAEMHVATWLAAHPDASEPNVIHLSRLVSFANSLGGGFFSDPSTSQGKPVLLRSVRRDGDVWRVVVEGPLHRTATLGIDDRDELVDVQEEH